MSKDEFEAEKHEGFDEIKIILTAKNNHKEKQTNQIIN